MHADAHRNTNDFAFIGRYVTVHDTLHLICIAWQVAHILYSTAMSVFILISPL